MRILIATDSFKGSLDAATACAVIARGARRVDPRAEIDSCPLADGGEGTASVIRTVLGGEWIDAEVSGPLPQERVRASYLWIAGARPTAVIDLAAASGLTLLPRERLDPLRATTYGTGELVRAAIERGAHRVWLALGGSATVDGAVGLAIALGWRFLDAAGQPIGLGGGELERIAKIVPPSPRARARVVALRDVENPLLGERGAGSGVRSAEGRDAAGSGTTGARSPSSRGGHRGRPGCGRAGSRRWWLSGRRRRRRGRVSRCDARARRATRFAPFALRCAVAPRRRRHHWRGPARRAVARRQGAFRRLRQRRHAAGSRSRSSRDAWRSTRPWPRPTEYARWRRRRSSEVPDAEALANAEPLLEAAAARLMTKLVDDHHGAR